MNENLAGKLMSSAERYPESVALRLGDAQLTYSQLDNATARVAGMLRERGIEPGERVGIMLPNVPQFAIAYYGVLRAGCVVVPMNVLLKQREVAFYLGDSEAKLMFAWHEFAQPAQDGAQAVGADCLVVEPVEFERVIGGVEPLRETAERAADEVAIILYTSGTTGTPKGAMLTHANMSRNAEVTARSVLELEPADVVLGALPLFHAFGQTCALNTTIAVGGLLALVPRFEPGKVLETIQRDRVTVFEGVPTMFAALLHHPEHERFDFSRLRLCVSGGAALPVEILRRFEETFRCIILEGYGLSETSPVACFNHPNRERQPGSIGTPIDGVEMKLVDDQRNEVSGDEVGEIAIRGHNIMQGYWNRPEATAEAIDGEGWFFSGDIAKVDGEGRYYIVDRKKELIIRGGYNVYPREIEEVLYEHPAVREAAVIGVPHPELGEEVAAAVALKAGATVSESELRDFVKANVAAYKYPRHVWFVEELPKGPTGKIVKREIEAPARVAAPEPGGGSR